MQKTIGAKALFLIILLFGCRDHKSIKSKLDFTKFEGVKPNSIFENLSFSDSFNYYEIRHSLCNDNNFNMLYSYGDKCINTDDSITCLKELDKIKPKSNGFHRNCKASCCHHYLVTENKGDIKVWASTNQLKKVLGIIDTPNEALLLAFAYGYYYLNNDKKNGSVSVEKDYYRVIALKVMSECAPAQTDRFLLNILPDGTINIEEQELYEKKNEACP